MKILNFRDWLVENAEINNVRIDNTGGYTYPVVGEENETNYMFFSNIKRISELTRMISKMDSSKIDSMLNDGHDWAEDHVATAKEKIEQVFDFLKGQNLKVEESKITSDLHRQYDMDPTWWAAWRMENEKEKGYKIEQDTMTNTYTVYKDKKPVFVFDYKRNKIFTNESPGAFILKDKVDPEKMKDIEKKANIITGDAPKEEKPKEDKQKEEE